MIKEAQYEQERNHFSPIHSQLLLLLSNFRKYKENLTQIRIKYKKSLKRSSHEDRDQ